MRSQPKPGHAKRAVLYLRQSTYREESISLAMQEEAGRAHCARNGYQIIDVLSDPGISGRTWKRPAVQKVLAMIEAKEADVIVLWKWSRLSRDDFDWSMARQIAKTAGGAIESATEPNDNETPEGRLMLSQMISMAVYESERIGKMWSDVNERRVRMGVPGSGGKRFGYVHVEKDVYKPDPVTGPVLREAYRRYVEEEHGWTKLVTWLNGAGYTTTTGAPFNPDKIRAIMDAGFGAGVLARGYRSKDITYLPGNQEAVITPEMWAAYRARRAQAPRPAGTVNPKASLSGLVVCGDCGSQMRSHVRTQNRKKVPGWACSRYLDYRDTRLVTAAQHLVESTVRAWLVELAADIEGLAAAQSRVAEKRAVAINDEEAISRRSTKLREQLGALTVRLVSGKITDDAYTAAAAMLQGELDNLAERIVERSHDSQAEVDVRLLSRSLNDRWEGMTNHAKRTMLSKLIVHVKVTPNEKRFGPVQYEVVPRW